MMYSIVRVLIVTQNIRSNCGTCTSYRDCQESIHPSELAVLTVALFPTFRFARLVNLLVSMHDSV